MHIRRPSLAGCLPVVAFVATTLTAVLVARLFADPIVEYDMADHLDDSSSVPPSSQFSFGRDGFFKLKASLEASSLTYSDALTIDTHDEVIVFQLSSGSTPELASNQFVRLVILHGSKFVEALPVNGEASLVMQPALTKRLCTSSNNEIPRHCSLSITIMHNEFWKGNRTVFTLRAARSLILAPDRPRIDMLNPYRPVKLAIAVNDDIVRLQMRTSCPSETSFGIISKEALLSQGLEKNRGVAPMKFSGTQRDIDVHKGFYFIAITSKRLCSNRIEIRRKKKTEWAWTSFGRIFLITLFVAFITGPSLFLCLARSPGSVATHEVPIELSDEELLIQQEQYRTALVKLAPQEFVEETLCNGGDTSCCICLDSYTEKQQIRRLPCSHFFHVGCVDPWLLNQGRCPLCRSSIIQEETLPEETQWGHSETRDIRRRFST